MDVFKQEDSVKNVICICYDFNIIVSFTFHNTVYDNNDMLYIIIIVKELSII